MLVVEDEALFARAIARRLEKAGYSVEVAPTLREAESRWLAAGADLLLLDMRLPDGSGPPARAAGREGRRTDDERLWRA